MSSPPAVECGTCLGNVDNPPQTSLFQTPGDGDGSHAGGEKE